VLNFVYYPVSGIMWCWHKVFGFVLGESSGISWLLSIVFLVFTLRALLLKPAIAQVRSMTRMQEFQPQIQALQKKHANDKQRLATEMQKLQSENGVNPIMGCLPMLIQIPVFIGLNHVLRMFAVGKTQNYWFGASDVHSYVNSKILGVNLDNAVVGFGAVNNYHGFNTSVLPVAIPLMIVASIATHMTARHSVARQALNPNVAANPQSGMQAAMMQKLSLYIFPLGVLIFGLWLPVGLLIYWFSNNLWTLGQQHFVYRRIDQEKAVEKEKAIEKRNSLAPKPGAKPVAQPKKTSTTGVSTGTSATPKAPAAKTTPAAKATTQPKKTSQPNKAKQGKTNN
jgi:YidC/Oxa1 family membrane protein insertase